MCMPFKKMWCDGEHNENNNGNSNDKDNEQPRHPTTDNASQ